MKRLAYSELLKWKKSKRRKPLIIRGARQVGKTWLMQKFASNEYKNTIYINFEESSNMKELFLKDFDIDRILLAFQLKTNIKAEPNNTLIILDEIQEAERGITSLKYFQENASEYHIMTAGSYLGISIHKGASFPVGKVDFLDLHPLNFNEFLMANGENAILELLQKKSWDMITLFKTKLIEQLRTYYFVGGMPEVVLSFIEEKSFKQVRKIQNQLLDAYEQDFSKHAPKEIIPRIRMLWQSLPAQLAKENKKFIFGLIKKGARAREYELAIEWLKDSGLIHTVFRIKKPSLPLISYKDNNAFKVYIFDVGLLGAMSKLDSKTLLLDKGVFEEFKGALTEQYVYQQLITNNEIAIYYWSSEKSSGEIDFIIQKENQVFPLEVKATENLKAKSLKAFKTKYNIEKSYRTSLSNFRKEEWMENIPLYGIGEVF
jgi:predicted AAA+ superfamily ATPase